MKDSNEHMNNWEREVSWASRSHSPNLIYVISRETPSEKEVNRV
jgi:hypothetical protein